MKKQSLFIITVFYSLSLVSQSSIIKLAEIKDPTEIQGNAISIEQDDLEKDDFKYELIITGAVNDTDLNNIDLFSVENGNNTQIDYSKNFTHDPLKKEISIDITTIITGIKNSTLIIEFKDKNKKVLYSFDIIIKATKNPTYQTEEQLFIEQEFKKTVLPSFKEKLGLSEKSGAYIDKYNTIHLFVDNYGKFYGRGIPTVATEKNSFQLHIMTTEKNVSKFSYSFKFVGEYRPTFNIDNTNEKANVTPNASGSSTDVLRVLDGPIKGPYTDSFSFTVNKYDVEKKVETVLTDAIINIPKLFHVSLSSGLIATTLKNPKNIEEKTLSNGNTTLVADDPNTRGVLTIMATFYPKGRSFLFPPSGNIFDPSRFGVQIGAQLSGEISENFFGGISFDFARGASISIGAHYGRRNFITGIEDFNFGEDLFDLNELVIKKEWDVGLYFGVVIDSRVAFKLLTSLGTSEN